jgi:hypothetical protein
MAQHALPRSTASPCCICMAAATMAPDGTNHTDRDFALDHRVVFESAHHGSTMHHAPPLTRVTRRGPHGRHHTRAYFQDAPNPNNPASAARNAHDGGCGGENTMLRIDGKLIMMESTEHSCDVVFPGYNTTTEGDCSYFRIRHVYGTCRHGEHASLSFSLGSTHSHTPSLEISGSHTHSLINRSAHSLRHAFDRSSSTTLHSLIGSLAHLLTHSAVSLHCT